MRTYFIWNQFDDGLKFGHVEYDATHLHGSYINSAGTSDGDTDDLNELQEEATWYDDLSAWITAIRGTDDAVAIECGFMP